MVCTAGHRCTAVSGRDAGRNVPPRRAAARDNPGPAATCDACRGYAGCGRMDASLRRTESCERVTPECGPTAALAALNARIGSNGGTRDGFPIQVRIDVAATQDDSNGLVAHIDLSAEQRCECHCAARF